MPHPHFVVCEVCKKTHFSAPCPVEQFPVGLRVWVKSIKARGVVHEVVVRSGGCLIRLENSPDPHFGPGPFGFGWSELEAYQPSAWELMDEDD